MSDQLFRAIRSVQKNISNHRNVFQKERQTVKSLIDPILGALGWDTNGPQHVEYERKTLSGEADIFLKREGYPVVIIEAKSLAESLRTGDLEQLTRYCNDSNVETGALTNGQEWRAYHFRRPQQIGKLIEPILLFQLSLGTDEKSAEVAKKELSFFSFDSIKKLEHSKRSLLLDKFWQAKGGDKVSEYLVRNYTKKFIDLFCGWSGLQIPPSQQKVVREDVQSLLREKLIPKQQLPDTHKSQQSHTQPIQTASGRFIELSGMSIPINRSNEVLIQTAEWLIARGKLGPQVCPVPLSGKRYLVHTRNQHSDGKPFTSEKKLSNGLFLEVNFSTRNLIQNARHLLNHLGYPPTTLKLIGFDD